MRAGSLREKISIYKEITTIDPDYGSPVNSFELVHNSRAKVRYLSGTETLENNTVSNTSSVLFTIRLKEGIDETMQVEYRGDRYNIQYMAENRKSQVMTLTTTKILN